MFMTSSLFLLSTLGTLGLTDAPAALSGPTLSIRLPEATRLLPAKLLGRNELPGADSLVLRFALPGDGLSLTDSADSTGDLSTLPALPARIWGPAPLALLGSLCDSLP